MSGQCTGKNIHQDETQILEVDQKQRAVASSQSEDDSFNDKSVCLLQDDESQWLSS